MKKHLLALAALATVSGVVAAQSVTMYGVLDVNVSVDNKGDTTSMGNGGLTPNIIGFKGAEDIGGGLKATFNLETHFSPNNGQVGLVGTVPPATGQVQSDKLTANLFARQANVGLSNSLGAVTFGNQYGAGVLAMAATDPRGLRESYSGLSFWLVPALGNAATNTIGNVFYNNAVGLSTKIGVASLAYTRTIGGVAGDTDKGSADSAGLVVTPLQGLTLSAGWGSSKILTGTAKDNSINSYGASYKFGNATVAVNRIVNKVYASGNVDKEVVATGFGGSYQLTAPLAINAAYYKAKDDKNTARKSDNYVVGLEYSLSKRTTAYVQAAFSDNDSTAVTGSFGGTASTSNNVTQVGVRHTF
jgi:predicted porin